MATAIVPSKENEYYQQEDAPIRQTMNNNVVDNDNTLGCMCYICPCFCYNGQTRFAWNWSIFVNKDNCFYGCCKCLCCCCHKKTN